MRTALRWLGGLVGLAAVAALMLGVGVWLGSQNAEPQTAGGGATPSASPLTVAALPSPAEVDYLIATPEPSGIVVGPTIRPGIPSAMPITGDCLACHETPQGGVGARRIAAAISRRAASICANNPPME